MMVRVYVAALALTAARSVRADDADFDYSRPADWPAEFPACAGQQQSPIDIDLENAIDSAPSFLKLFMPRVPMVNLDYSVGSAIKLSLKERNITLTTSGLADQYTLLQVHYHTPSEHTVNGVRYPLERHLVFAPTDAAHLRFAYPLAVVAELYAVDDARAGDAMVADLLAKGGSSSGAVRLFPSFDFHADEFVTYRGSLTTPPCSEGVHWHVSATPHTITSQQAHAVNAIIAQSPAAAPGGSPGPTHGPVQYDKGNARPVQNRNSRCVESTAEQPCSDPPRRKRFFGPN
ncbi:Alpha carbonic anhydrase 8 [Diplonema papillatum]|nr:Alpha carbonic anhydrase 8 [Diplonema papillatum]